LSNLLHKSQYNNEKLDGSSESSAYAFESSNLNNSSELTHYNDGSSSSLNGLEFNYRNNNLGAIEGHTQIVGLDSVGISKSVNIKSDIRTADHPIIPRCSGNQNSERIPFLDIPYCSIQNDFNQKGNNSNETAQDGNLTECPVVNIDNQVDIPNCNIKNDYNTMGNTNSLGTVVSINEAAQEWNINNTAQERNINNTE